MITTVSKAVHTVTLFSPTIKCFYSAPAGTDFSRTADCIADFICSTLFRPLHSLSRAGYSHQTLPWTICRSVCPSSALWKNGRSDPDAVWHHRSDRSRDEADSGVCGSVHGKGYF